MAGPGHGVSTSPGVQLLERRWVMGHLLALLMAAIFVSLGVWQLARNTHKHKLVDARRPPTPSPRPA